MINRTYLKQAMYLSDKKKELESLFQELHYNLNGLVNTYLVKSAQEKYFVKQALSGLFGPRREEIEEIAREVNQQHDWSTLQLISLILGLIAATKLGSIGTMYAIKRWGSEGLKDFFNLDKWVERAKERATQPTRAAAP